MFLAHKVTNEDCTRIQTLKNHSENVSLLMQSFLVDIDFRNLAYVVGYLHDLGKAKHEFQDYLYNTEKYAKNSVIHSPSGGIYIYRKFLHKQDLTERITDQLIFLAMISHHSGLSDCLDTYGVDQLTKCLARDDEIFVEESINNFFLECIDECSIDSKIHDACKEVQHFIEQNRMIYKSGEESWFSLGMLEKHIFSCLIDADRFDTACFYNEIKIETEEESPQNWDKLLTRLENHIATFKNDSKINQLRNEISDSCKLFAQKPQGIYQLYVPTGGGKTLSSLRFALTHAKTHENIKRIIYVMPYLTILSQNSKTLKEILEKDEEHFILEHFSNLVEDEKMDEDDVSKKDALIERWNSEIVITSMVHFLESLFLGKGQATRRMHQLANAIIIIDEIQTLPDRDVYMFNQAMDYLKNFCNSTIVLCSATQPTLHDVKYPIQLTEPTYIVKDYQKKFFEFKRVDIIDKTKSIAYCIEDIAELIYEKVSKIDNMLIILNTKDGVVATYKELLRRNEQLPEEDRFHIICLTTNMCPQHRYEKVEWIRQNLNKERILCVSTSLIEAGIDISFKAVIRALTGLDSIAQAAGRCNRHGELDKGYLYLINTDESIQKLEKVIKGIRIMIMVLDEYKINRSKFDDDLLSPKSLELYYRRYYYESEAALGYPSDKLNGLDMFSCLSANVEAQHKFADCEKKQYPYVLNQSFHSCGEVFEVIEKNTTSIIVPFGKGKKIIVEILRRSPDLAYIKQLLQSAQQYSISIYTSGNKSDLLEHGIEYIKEYNLYILKEGDYDNEIGLCDYFSSIYDY